MRPLLLLVPLLAVACDQNLKARPPLNDRFYYPTGIAWSRPIDAAHPADTTLGRIYVSSSNFDRRFDTGWVTAVDLDRVRSASGASIPQPGAPAPASDAGTGPLQFTRLDVPDGGPSEAHLVRVEDFAAVSTLDPTGRRLFVPSRGDTDYVAVLDVSGDGGVPIRCFFAQGATGNDCIKDAIPLALNQNPGATPNDVGLPAAPQPYSVTLAPDSDEIYVTHLRPASSPAQSNLNLQNYLVTLRQSELDAARASWSTTGRYVPSDTHYSTIGTGASDTIVVTPGFLYVSGRAKIYSSQPDVLLRVVDRATKFLSFPSVQTVWPSLDARGLVLRPDGKRLYLAVDNPASLLVLDIVNEDVFSPNFVLVRAVPLPSGPNVVRLVPRPGRTPLVVVSCVVDGSLAFYDDDVGQIAASLPGVGAEPYDIAVDQRPGVARLYVTNFGDGRVAIVDVNLPTGTGTPPPPLQPRLVGHIGALQFCVIQKDERDCEVPK